jgi:hypothetical protein
MEVKSIQEILMNAQFNQQKPTLVNAIAWMTLASGIVNLFWGFALSGTALVTIIGIICVPLAILPSILGVFEIIYAAKLFSTPPQVVKPSTNIAVFEITSILAFNVFSMAVGILSLVFYNDTVVKDYFSRLNGTLPPEPFTSPEPASLPEPEPFDSTQDKPAPVIEEPAPTPEDAPSESAPVEQQPEEKPAKPKRTPRKVAKK